MTIYIVWNFEEWVGTFFVAAFETKEEAEKFAAANTNKYDKLSVEEYEVRKTHVV